MPETYNNNFLQTNSKQPELPRAGQPGQWLVSAEQFVYKCAIIHHLVFNYRIIVSVVSETGDGFENMSLVLNIINTRNYVECHTAVKIVMSIVHN